MAKRLGMGQKKKRPEDLTELERFLQLNRQVGTVPIAEVETDPYGSVVRGPGSRQRAILIEEPPLPRIDHDPIVSGPSRRGEPAVPEEAYPGPISGLLPEVSQADIHDQMIEEWTPYKEATRQMAVDEEAREEAARVAAEEKAYTEGRIYGNYSEDIGAKRQRYMDALEEIQTKARRLNMIAGLTGGTSQADSFTKAALARLDKMEEFSDDERLHQIRTGVYYDQNGNWAPPKSKKEAYNRAVQFGASAAEAAHISGGEPEPVGYVNWRYTGDDPNVQKIISRPRGDPPDDPEYVRYGGTAEDASTSKDERHLLARSALLQGGDVLGAIQKEVDFIGTFRPTGDPEQHRAIATQRIWPLIPHTMKHEEMFNSQEEIDAAEAELYAAGIRWVLLGPAISPKLVQLEPPPEEPIVEEEDKKFLGIF